MRLAFRYRPKPNRSWKISIKFAGRRIKYSGRNIREVIEFLEGVEKNEVQMVCGHSQNARNHNCP